MDSERFDAAAMVTRCMRGQQPEFFVVNPERIGHETFSEVISSESAPPASRENLAEEPMGHPQATPLAAEP